MGNLIREQRVDKNGNLNTKLVRADSRRKTGLKPIPMPSAEAVVKIVADMRQKRWRVSEREWKADAELSALCCSLNPARTYTCSDAEAYDVISVVSPEDTLPLLAVGIRTSQDALKFLDDSGLSHLAVDNTQITEAAIERGLALHPMLDFWSENSEYTEYESFMDGAETHCMMSPHLPKGNTEAAERVLHGMVDLEDIKTVGVQRLARADISPNDPEPVALNQLQKIKEGVSEYDATMIRKMLNHSGKGGLVDSTILTLAKEYGVDTMLGINDVYAANVINEALRRTMYDREQRADILVLNDLLKDVKWLSPLDTCAVYDSYREAGLDLHQTVDGIKRDLTPAQLRAVIDGDVIPAIADGWL